MNIVVIKMIKVPETRNVMFWFENWRFWLDL